MSFFDRAVDFFEQVQATPFYKRLLQEFVSFIEIRPDMSAVDIGCGPGYLTRLLAERVKAMSCVDISAAMVQRAREHAREENVENASYTVGRAENIPEQSEYFDVAVATSVIYFVEDPVVALKEMARVVKKGGRVAMMNPSDKMTGRNVISYIERHGLGNREARVLEDWLYAAEGARRFSEHDATRIMSAVGLSQISHERRLDDMVLFSKATKV
ncbi:MAG: class I SAM-dependent methyltransferase [Actinobacteria bacterium]|nr:class I SAM-dependent methyltransferase [Actinomycetota bacterium]